MKKLRFLFIALTLVVMSSCSSDDSTDSPNVTGDLLGTWIGVDVDYTTSTVTTAQGQSFTADGVGEAYDVNYTLIFTENPNEIIADGTYSIELTTTVLGQTQVDNFENLEFLTNSTWTRSGNELTVVSEGESSIVTILELTDTTLKLGIETTQDLSQPGFEIVTTVNAISTYARM